MGAFPGGGVEGPKTTEALVANVDKFDLVVHAGDIAYDYGWQFVWDYFGRQVEPLASQIPYMTAVGNHESDYNFTAYMFRFTSPSGSSNSDSPMWYSFDHGLAHYVMFSTEHDYNAGSPQYNWLINDLQKANDNRATVPWIIAVGHRPMYCSNAYVSCSETGVQSALEPLFLENKVNIAFWGHVHAYERMAPIRNFTVAGDYQNPNGTVHMLVGMAGAICCGDYWNSPSPVWSMFRDSEYFGFVQMNITETSIVLQYIINPGVQVYDTAELLPWQ
jgi:hypothetical protein